MKKASKHITGLHILGEIYTNNIKNLKSMTGTRRAVSKIIKRNHLKELGSFYHKFLDGGFTGIISLIESHIAVHTWPELQYLTLDVYICNYKNNNELVCRKVFDEISRLFRPSKIRKRMIKR